MLRALLKIAIASAVMGAVGWRVEAWLHDVLPSPDIWWRLLRVVGAIGASVATLGLMAAVLRIEEFMLAVHRAAGRFRG